MAPDPTRPVIQAIEAYIAALSDTDIKKMLTRTREPDTRDKANQLLSQSGIGNSAAQQ